MPSLNELLVLLLAIFAIWFVLKLARIAIRVIFLLISIAVLVGVLWFVFS
ncbi:MAG TPA: hypothetical protein VEU30_07320 [Thermoanaerobaculia bacterium]|nr:hypothetical protein [Thermoanaerobaculia bacterium]